MINYAGKFGISREPREVQTPSMSISIGGKVGRRKNGKNWLHRACDCRSCDACPSQTATASVSSKITRCQGRDRHELLINSNLYSLF